jgi:hypothetical protein
MSAALAMVALGLLATTTPTVPDAQVAGDVGDVRLVQFDGMLVNSGDGTTKFFIVLPDDAACPGDSANDQWRTHSFLVREDDDVLGLWFGSSGPEPPWENDRYPMFNVANGLPMAQMMLQRNEVAGQPGVVEQSVETSFAVHAENGIASGRYRIGMACAYFRQTTQFWDLVIDIATDGSTRPEGLQWTVVASEGAEVPTAPFDTEKWVGRLIVGVGALVVLWLVVTRRRPESIPARSRPLAKEATP